MLYPNLSVNSAGHLAMAGYDTVELAKEYGTPLYIMDENRIRENCRTYVQGMKEAFGEGSGPLYASKALCTTGICRLMHEENMRLDAVSCGEIFTALRAGMPAENIYFHGNGKTDADIRWAMEHKIGFFVVDNPAELEAVNDCARELGMRQKILLRITAGIDSHTFEAVNTGKIDCQFGVPLGTDDAVDFVRAALAADYTELMGFHCHIGSQIFAWTPFRDAVNVMLQFILDIRTELGFVTKVLDLGGGFGVRYLDYDPDADIYSHILRLGKHVKDSCAELGLEVPEILMEPGRSIVGDAGLTIYTVTAVKSRIGGRSYVVVDGGMTDNPRHILYNAEYTVLPANKAGQRPNFLCTLAGRCCETGDRIQEDVVLVSPTRGDMVAVLTTGAYNYSMASNYNRLPRPAMVMLTDDGPKLAVRRETLEDIVACDI